MSVETPEAEDRTPQWLKSRLVVALRNANLGVPVSWPLERQATYAVRLIGGGRVAFGSPSTVRRAISLLEAPAA
jgi:hypothetical protein